MSSSSRISGKIRLSPRDHGSAGSRRSTHRRRPAIFRLERLEDRTVLSPYLVTTPLDLVDPHDFVLSLREAIEAANAYSDADVINFAPGLHGTITLSGELGQLAITENLSIVGPAPNKLTISGNDQTRIFYISPGTTAVISGLTVAHGLADGTSPILHSVGGGILNQGTLTLEDVVVSHNQAVGVTNDTIYVNSLPLNGVGIGGGVANLGTLAVSGSVFTGNLARGANNNQGGYFPGLAGGGGLANAGMGTPSVTDSRFASNLAQGGNGSIVASVTPPITPPGWGGGGAIANYPFGLLTSPGSVTLTVSNSSFSSNQGIGGDDNQCLRYAGTGLGGAIASHRLVQFGGFATLNVSDSTFDHNQAIGGNHNLATPRGAADPAPSMSPPKSSPPTDFRGSP